MSTSNNNQKSWIYLKILILYSILEIEDIVSEQSEHKIKQNDSTIIGMISTILFDLCIYFNDLKTNFIENENETKGKSKRIYFNGIKYIILFA